MLTRVNGIYYSIDLNYYYSCLVLGYKEANLETPKVNSPSWNDLANLAEGNKKKRDFCNSSSKKCFPLLHR